MILAGTFPHAAWLTHVPLKKSDTALCPVLFILMFQRSPVQHVLLQLPHFVRSRRVDRSLVAAPSLTQGSLGCVARLNG